MNTIHKLTDFFRNFPGIGPKQAKRFVYHLLSLDGDTADEFIAAIQKLRQEVKLCGTCFRYHTKQKGNTPHCDICSDASRDPGQLMIVSKDVDLEVVERSKAFVGHYFVLGGTVPILEQNPDKKIRAAELERAIMQRAGTGLKEIIFALNANPEGENTVHFLLERLSPLADARSIKLSMLGRGLSTGTELEYSDADTLKSALRNRS